MVVVGGGPAGLAVAIRARQAGLSVAVLDSRRPPIDQPCGEGLMPEGVAVLADLGVAPPLSREFHGIRYLDGDLQAQGRFHSPPGLGIRRIELHRALSARAEQLGAELLWGERATGLSKDGVVTADGVLPATWTVGADGRHSRLRGWVGLAPPTQRSPRFGARRHFQVAPWSDLVEVYWHEHCEAYVTPVSTDLVCVALIWNGRASGYDDLLALLPALAARLAGAPAVTRVAGAGPFGTRAPAVRRGRVLLMGDAAQSLDPITGEGVTLALSHAGEVVRAVVQGDPDSWVTAQRRLGRAPARLSRLVMMLERRPPLRRRIISALAADPALFDRFLACRHSSGPAVLHALLRLLLRMAMPAVRTAC